MKNVTVIGGSGFLGSYVADELTSRGYDVLIADIRHSNYIQDTQKFIICDITDPSSLVTAVREASVVYNFAGLADIDEASKSPKEAIEKNANQKAEIERFYKKESNKAKLSDDLLDQKILDMLKEHSKIKEKDTNTADLHAGHNHP